MQDLFYVIQKCALFEGLDEAEIKAALGCLGAEKRGFSKGENVFGKGFRMGLVLAGALQNVNVDYGGNQNIVASFYPSDVFGEALVCAHAAATDIWLRAAENSQVLFLNYDKLLTVCGNTCSFHQRLIKNMLRILARKNLYLSGKLRHISRRTTREKIMSYLCAQAAALGSREFTIPYDRQQMADYLAVERSALSAQLGRLRDEGVITFCKNRFCILEQG